MVGRSPQRATGGRYRRRRARMPHVDELLHQTNDSLERFVARWYGPLPEPASWRNADLSCPPALQHWYALSRRAPLTSQNDVLERQRLTPGEDGMVVFYVENQGVWLWAYDPADGDDPQVHERENEYGIAWTPSGSRLSEFLLQVAVFEAVLGAEHAAATYWSTPSQARTILAGLSPMPMAHWSWPHPGHHFYVGEDLMALAGPAVDHGESPT
jgi:hypothetical protein